MIERRMGEELAPVAFSAAETAEYIADLTQELARMAERSRLDLLSSILKIARLEAMSSVRRLVPVDGALSHEE